MTVLSQKEWEDAVIADWKKQQKQHSYSWYDECEAQYQELFGSRGREERTARRANAKQLPFGDISELERLPDSKYKNDTYDGRIGEIAVIERLNQYGFNVPIESWTLHEPGKRYDQKDIVVNEQRLEVKYIKNANYPFGDTPDSFTGSQLLVAKVASIKKHIQPPLAYVFVHANTGGMLVLPFTDEVTSRFYERDAMSDGKPTPMFYLKNPQQYLQPFNWLVDALGKENQ
ncbi:MAG: hypothetical protein KME05_00440 [Gloeocapsa sp. UFS-A4-WI-NPMV-4B04]|jgi:hypothetical protein|nr:hypothetical protein [Gloeocapsa sp. UFS-A4-WI-NPMV-4B04]